MLDAGSAEAQLATISVGDRGHTRARESYFFGWHFGTARVGESGACAFPYSYSQYIPYATV